MQFDGLNFFLRSILYFNFNLLRWRYPDVIMAVGGEDESNKYFSDRKKNLQEITIEYGRLFNFIRHDSAEYLHSTNYRQHRCFRACS
jgi:hypothetical protein